MSLDAGDLVASVARGEPRAMARAITMVERGGPAGERLASQLYQRGGRALVVGVTGAAGTGKSTLVDRLIAVVRGQGKTVGVVAVDPTSPFTGGALLGDRLRMAAHAGDAGVFIRSMATRGQMGGLAAATADAVAVLDAGGYDVVLVETVGVGQDEVEVMRLATVTVLVLVPGTGDDVQAIKAGIMEIADVFVVNKADREGADRAVEAVAASLALAPAGSGDQPPIVKTRATTGEGVGDVWAAVERAAAHHARNPEARAARRADAAVRSAVTIVAARLVGARIPPAVWEAAIAAVAARTSSPADTAERLLAQACREDEGR